MGGTSTPSKRKSSSSSHKKKRSINTSQVRKRKRSRSKIRKNKSKKLRRRDESISSSDDDSRSVSSISSSSSSDSDDEYRRRRSRSRTRKDVKKRSKKSIRRRSSSSESSPNARRVKKKKGSKRKVELDLKKKRRAKKSKRDVSFSSESSGSQRCSTRRGDVSDEEIEYEERRGRSERRENASTKKYEWPSKDDGYGYQNEEKMVCENNLSRLRSVITVPKNPEKSDEREVDKEEIIYDHDEYPSCKSNDSNDMGVDRELPDCYSDDVMSGRPNEIMVSPIDEDDRYDGNFPISDVVEENNRPIESNIEDSVIIASPGSPDNVDLELILRQRALENLKKFRGHQIKTADDGKKNDSQVENTEDGAKVSNATPVVDQNNEILITKITDHSSQNDDNLRIGGYNKPRSAAFKIVQLKSNKEEVTNKAKNPIPSLQNARKLQDNIKNVSRPPRLVRSGHAKDSENDSACTLEGQGCTSQTYTKEKQLESEGEINNSASETSKTLLNSSNNNCELVSNASGSAAPGASSIEPVSDDQGSKDVQGEAKEGSQYEQKTMSVMRGGEKVQVSYKVYIPKKTPALARRQLKR